LDRYLYAFEKLTLNNRNNSRMSRQKR